MAQHSRPRLPKDITHDRPEKAETRSQEYRPLPRRRATPCPTTPARERPEAVALEPLKKTPNAPIPHWSSGTGSLLPGGKGSIAVGVDPDHLLSHLLGLIVSSSKKSGRRQHHKIRAKAELRRTISCGSPQAREAQEGATQARPNSNVTSRGPNSGFEVVHGFRRCCQNGHRRAEQVKNRFENEDEPPNSPLQRKGDRGAAWQIMHQSPANGRCGL